MLVKFILVVRFAINFNCRTAERMRRQMKYNANRHHTVSIFRIMCQDLWYKGVE